jgi:hypothetical protein
MLRIVLKIEGAQRTTQLYIDHIDSKDFEDIFFAVFEIFAVQLSQLG